ncbi:MAG: hypothetical protein ABIJ45_13885 [Candidatus Zixiibacteriota bacterium]
MSDLNKKYFQALIALKNKDYSAAVGFFKAAENQFADSLEFRILQETTELLLAVKNEIIELETEKVSA